MAEMSRVYNEGGRELYIGAGDRERDLCGVQPRCEYRIGIGPFRFWTACNLNSSPVGTSRERHMVSPAAERWIYEIS